MGLYGRHSRIAATGRHGRTLDVGVKLGTEGGLSDGSGMRI
jgi:hypothetical protein